MCVCVCVCVVCVWCVYVSRYVCACVCGEAVVRCTCVFCFIFGVCFFFFMMIW